MANVEWASPGTSGDWDITANWNGLPIGESYPGEVPAFADIITISASNSAYTVTFNVPSVTVSSLTIEGGNGTNHATTLRMTAGTTLNVQGGVTLFKKDSNASIDGAGTISLFGGQIDLAGSAEPVEGTITAGTDTTGGVLNLTGSGIVSAPIAFAIGTAAPSTLKFDLVGGVVTSRAITIDHVNQTLEIGSSGSFATSVAQNVTNGTILMTGGTFTGTSGLSFGTNMSSGSLSGFGTVTGVLTMSGTGIANTVTASGGNLTLNTAIGSNSGLIFAVGPTSASALQLNAAPGTGNNFTFVGAAGELALTSSAANGFNNTIFGLDVGLTLTPTNLVHILDDSSVTVASGEVGVGSSGTVTLSNGAILHLSGVTNASGTWFVHTAPDSGGTGTEIFLSAVCFARGTMILTPVGERAVETLRQGQQVIALINGVKVPRAVKWVGHRRINLTRHPRPEAIAPVRISRHAFADNEPHADLLLSPDHAVFVDGVLIGIRQLVNGATIRVERGWPAVDYYHVELNDHAILLAAGLPVESYLDTGNRAFFANTDAPLVLHPNLPNEHRYPTRDTGSCARFVRDAGSVRPTWLYLADRAGALGQPLPARSTTSDTGIRIQVFGRRIIAPISCDRDRAVFVLPRDATDVRLISRAQAPTEARPWLEDRRQLGVRVKRIVLRDTQVVREVPMDQPDFKQGWWAVEHDGPVMSRWTDGTAVLPLPTMHGPTVLEIHLAGAMTYVEDIAPPGNAVRVAS